MFLIIVNNHNLTLKSDPKHGLCKTTIEAL
jgi:hypothetical protein